MLTYLPEFQDETEKIAAERINNFLKQSPPRKHIPKVIRKQAASILTAS